MVYVLYHKNCMDGKGAAYAAWLKFKENAEYIEVGYGDPLPEIENNSEVYILDFSYPKDILIQLNERCKVVVLDHHKTAQNDLEGLTFAHFNMNKSGASLAWEYLHPNEKKNEHINFIEDRDLWNWKLKNSKEYSLGAYSLIKNFKDFDKYSFFQLIDAGNNISIYQSQQIESILQNSFVTIMEFDNKEYKVAMVNSPILQSELGDELLGKYPDVDFAWVYREDKDNSYVSLRSEDRRKDVSVIAKLFGGGGHRNASGLTQNLIRGKITK